MLDSILSGKLHDSPPKSFAAISMPSRWKTYSKKKRAPQGALFLGVKRGGD